MQMIRVTLKPVTPFGTPFLGEILFGQLCWAVHRLYGEDRLVALLDGYADGRPFAVLSDAMPEGFVPLPTLPNYLWQNDDGERRKYLKKKAWLPVDALNDDPFTWQESACSDEEVCRSGLRVEEVVMHNTINRLSETTATGRFAPFMKPQTWLNPNQPLSVYAVIDESRFTQEMLLDALTCVGQSGFGRDASVGLGKFELCEKVETIELKQACRTHVTLASSVLSAVPDLVEAETFYRTKTHFGRHGEVLALTGSPFKFPIMLATAGAVVTTKEPQTFLTIGRGLSRVSIAQPEAVHQGYSPVLPLNGLDPDRN